MGNRSNQLDGWRQKLLAVFPKTEPPSAAKITSHDCEECDVVRDDFRNLKWWSANSELIDYHFGDLPLFTPEAYHYFLPAFLLRALENFETDNLVLQFCIYSLTPTDTPTDDPWYSARLNRFTPEEMSVISDFLECIRDDEEFFDYHADVERGLDKFWQVAKD
jgi:hypothetical protein